MFLFLKVNLELKLRYHVETEVSCWIAGSLIISLNFNFVSHSLFILACNLF